MELESRWRSAVAPLLCKVWVHKQHPISLLGPLVGGVWRNAALLCFIYDKICLFNFAVVRIWICDSFYLVGSGKSSGSLTPAALADVFRCYVLCGLSELIFYSRPSGILWNRLIFLPSFNQIFFQTWGKWCESVHSATVEMSLNWLGGRGPANKPPEKVLFCHGYIIIPSFYYTFFTSKYSFQKIVCLTTRFKD